MTECTAAWSHRASHSTTSHACHTTTLLVGAARSVPRLGGQDSIMAESRHKQQCRSHSETPGAAPTAKQVMLLTAAEHALAGQCAQKVLHP